MYGNIPLNFDLTWVITIRNHILISYYCYPELVVMHPLLQKWIQWELVTPTFTNPFVSLIQSVVHSTGHEFPPSPPRYNILHLIYTHIALD